MTMLDLNFIRQNPDKIKTNNQIRKCEVDVDDILKLDAARRELVSKIDSLRAALNQKSKSKPEAKEIASLKSLGEKIKKLEAKLKSIEDDWRDLLIQLPNITHSSVPVGQDETGNVVVKTWGKVPKFTFPPQEHWQLGERLDLIDMERGAKVSGARFWYLKNDLVMLEFALIQYAAQFMRDKGFIPMLVPILVRERAMFGTGFFPADENEIYQVNSEEEKMYLIGTSEVPLASYHMDEVLDVADEPLKYFGFSTCFRREAGAAGKDMRGIIRGHQFDKLEMLVFCNETDSWSIHEEMLKIAEKFWQSLKIPYQVLNMCTGDIGAPNAKKYDIEGWLPGQGKYREVASCSNDTDFQARRLGIKYAGKDGNKKFVHTLNNTVCALGRTMVAIMENYQQPDGSIEIPKVLRVWMGGRSKISKSA
ncbi:MAG: Serine-tRNA ligase [Candidatus Giovannonibacteria bacterium GW2011_GWA2_53_7]|uniref:Serine--tRNA ligase n=1 Tax=Candidatus Giovannonibacteria bacterium GW2011_GWA2_53_7 TaxID=1618650 RepID=A0A0G2ANL0_9BACT|nr:MAG: Serine-tRNA ligase [Candidatus Giovannonibacteria bacterium GW2011_GWA2_53_7]